MPKWQAEYAADVQPHTRRALAEGNRDLVNVFPSIWTISAIDPAQRIARVPTGPAIGSAAFNAGVRQAHRPWANTLNPPPTLTLTAAERAAITADLVGYIPRNGHAAVVTEPMLTGDNSVPPQGALIDILPEFLAQLGNHRRADTFV